MKGAADPEHGDLSELRVYAATPINSHGGHHIEVANSPPFSTAIQEGMSI